MEWASCPFLIFSVVQDAHPTYIHSLIQQRRIITLNTNLPHLPISPSIFLMTEVN
ncbi:MAG: hypothetical protein F6J94_00355 [Moorea sp. SIO1F2]|uniref:hypothetical protein n=1 Tax=Moorena sp. SIO1F2 TaxID=2607819 RepID=UPI0013B711A7|nr:hypothetical protein [Moorena sp. SIO1F2]NET80496.1 hypothetical protein [Moorena sp. SIO1F2]